MARIRGAVVGYWCRMRTLPVVTRFVHALERSEALDSVARPVDLASDALGDGAAVAALRGDWQGHAAHPFLTDIPIGCWTSAALLDLFGGRSARAGAQHLVGIGLLAAPLVAATGLADYRSVGDGPDRRVAAVHATGNALGVAVYAWSWRRRRAGAHRRGALIGCVGLGLLSVTGYLGGHLSFARSTGAGERGTLDRPEVITHPI
ncbi:MAG: DUF2231 domain-containing protein [Ilumatobacteraceae bacterium]